MFSPLGVLDVLQVRASHPSDRKPNWVQRLAGLATKPGEKCGLDRKKHEIEPAMYTSAMAEDDRELAYYRAVEDLFAALRGVPHLLSPKDFQLLRTWWREEIPLSAIRAGITEVFARRRERGELEHVVSLSYCRHAVKAQAKRSAEMHVGAAADSTASSPADLASALDRLGSLLAASSKRVRDEKPLVAEAIDRIATEVGAAVDLPEAAVEQHLFALESALLGNCLDALDERSRSALEAEARAEAQASSASPEARDRAFLALRDRGLRKLLDLPRLELEE